MIQPNSKIHTTEHSTEQHYNNEIKYCGRTFPLQCTASELQTASAPSETKITTYYSFNLTQATKKPDNVHRIYAECVF